MIFDRPDCETSALLEAWAAREGEGGGRERVAGKFTNQDSSRSVYWIVTREEREMAKGEEVRGRRGRGHWHSIREEVSLKVEY